MECFAWAIDGHGGHWRREEEQQKVFGRDVVTGAFCGPMSALTAFDVAGAP